MAAVACHAAALAAAPAPDGDKAARQTFEELKKRLPKVADGWVRERWQKMANYPETRDRPGFSAEVRLARRVGPAEAKVTVVIRMTSGGERMAWADQVVTLHLRYFEGSWTTRRLDTSWPSAAPREGRVHGGRQVPGAGRGRERRQMSRREALEPGAKSQGNQMGVSPARKGGAAGGSREPAHGRRDGGGVSWRAPS
jgi:hypothetical protein